MERDTGIIDRCPVNVIVIRYYINSSLFGYVFRYVNLMILNCFGAGRKIDIFHHVAPLFPNNPPSMILTLPNHVILRLLDTPNQSKRRLARHYQIF